jgi:superfamily II DNA or RNA helicase
VTLNLRPYQSELLDATRRALRWHRRVLMQLPTGGGKTHIATAMMQGAAAQGRRVLFVVHRKELVEQTARTLDRAGVEHGFCAAGFPADYRKAVTLATVQTLAARLDKIPEPDLIVLDEAHHAAAATWRRALAAWPTAWLVGLSATPQRLDGRALDGIFRVIVPGPSVSELIEADFLAPYRIWSHPAPDVSHVALRGADYDPRGLAEELDRPRLLGDAVEHYLRICPNAQAVAFCINVRHALNLRDAFCARGVIAEELDGSADPTTRRDIVAAFRRGDIRVLTSVDLFGEGFDLPELTASILMRPTRSLGLYLQQVGRCLRTADGKTHAIILDHAGNVDRHGLPDQERDWRLAGRPKRRGAAPIKYCPNCFACVPAAARDCPICGEAFLTQARDIETTAGHLSEVDLALIRAARRVEERNATTREELEAIARARGYKPGWVMHKLAARARRQRTAAPLEV